VPGNTFLYSQKGDKHIEQKLRGVRNGGKEQQAQGRCGVESSEGRKAFSDRGTRFGQGETDRGQKKCGQWKNVERLLNQRIYGGEVKEEENKVRRPGKGSVGERGAIAVVGTKPRTIRDVGTGSSRTRQKRRGNDISAREQAHQRLVGRGRSPPPIPRLKADEKTFEGRRTLLNAV